MTELKNINPPVKLCEECSESIDDKYLEEDDSGECSRCRNTEKLYVVIKVPYPIPREYPYWMDNYV